MHDCPSRPRNASLAIEDASKPNSFSLAHFSSVRMGVLAPSAVSGTASTAILRNLRPIASAANNEDFTATKALPFFSRY